MNRQASTHHRGEHGAALLELGVVIPVLFFLLTATFEVSRMMSFRNQNEVFAQELSRAIFHRCKDSDPDDGIEYTALEASQCVRNQVDTLHQFFRRTNPRSIALASIFRKEPGGLTQFAGPYKSCSPDVGPPASSSCADTTTQFTLPRAAAELSVLAETTGWVVVTEVYARPMSGLQQALEPLRLGTSGFYSVAVL